MKCETYLKISYDDVVSFVVIAKEGLLCILSFSNCQLPVLSCRNDCQRRSASLVSKEDCTIQECKRPELPLKVMLA